MKKNYVQKALLWVILFTFVLSLTACGGSGESVTSTASVESSTPSVATTQDTSKEAEKTPATISYDSPILA